MYFPFLGNPHPFLHLPILFFPEPTARSIAPGCAASLGLPSDELLLPTPRTALYTDPVLCFQPIAVQHGPCLHLFFLSSTKSSLSLGTVSDEPLTSQSRLGSKKSSSLARQIQLTLVNYAFYSSKFTYMLKCTYNSKINTHEILTVICTICAGQQAT
jgi:hypothetical protein